jgi:hypothetical protein
MDQKIENMRFVANSERQGSVVVPRTVVRYETLLEKDTRGFSPMTPSSFKVRNSQDLLRDPARFKAIQTLDVIMGSKRKLDIPVEDTYQSSANIFLENIATS